MAAIIIEPDDLDVDNTAAWFILAHAAIAFFALVCICVRPYIPSLDPDPRPTSYGGIRMPIGWKPTPGPSFSEAIASSGAMAAVLFVVFVFIVPQSSGAYVQ
jgi:hypothetical protein